MIDWTDHFSHVTEHFTVGDCIHLHLWNRLATEADGLTEEVKRNLMATCMIAEQVRAHLCRPMNVHSMYRPPEYSVAVGGGLRDVHTLGQAIDFDCLPALTCDAVKLRMMPELERLQLRMENNGPGSSWVHLDTHPVIHKRYFDP